MPYLITSPAWGETLPGPFRLHIRLQLWVQAALLGLLGYLQCLCPCTGLRQGTHQVIGLTKSHTWGWGGDAPFAFRHNALLAWSQPEQTCSMPSSSSPEWTARCGRPQPAYPICCQRPGKDTPWHRQPYIWTYHALNVSCFTLIYFKIFFSCLRSIMTLWNMPKWVSISKLPWKISRLKR